MNKRRDLAKALIELMPTPGTRLGKTGWAYVMIAFKDTHWLQELFPKTVSLRLLLKESGRSSELKEGGGVRTRLSTLSYLLH